MVQNSSQMEGKNTVILKVLVDIMIGLSKEKSYPENAATVLIMLIGNRTLKAKP